MKKLIQSPAKSYGAFIVIDEGQNWHVIIDGISHDICSSDSAVKLCLTTFMEIDFETFQQRLSDDPVARANIGNFPYGKFIRAGFEFGSSATILDTLNWLKNLRADDVVEFKSELAVIVSKKKYYDQKTRQLALKLMSQATPDMTSSKGWTT